ncbi:hypothetical protein Bbelb_181350 [Branchiostoma belcheri]|nr:hypothetical protein Bbelb_181350 [Branchiostoma belcheri]
MSPFYRPPGPAACAVRRRKTAISALMSTRGRSSHGGNGKICGIRCGGDEKLRQGFLLSAKVARVPGAGGTLSINAGDKGTLMAIVMPLTHRAVERQAFRPPSSNIEHAKTASTHVKCP